jgi:hypothetical protein
MIELNQEDRFLPSISWPIQWLCLAVMVIATPSPQAQQTPAPQNEPSKDTVIASAANSIPPMEMPPNPPQISCAGDQLTIKANNATLASVLSAVGTCLGTKIDVPEGPAAAERMYVEFGPGPVREILASLLSSTDFNFVISASQSNPEKIDTVLVLLRTEGPTVPAEPAPTRARRAWVENQRNAEAMRAAREDAAQNTVESAESTAATDTVPPENAKVDPNPANASETPAVDATASANSTIAGNPASSAASSAQGKTTQQMIGDMRQLFEQRRQMVESQKSTPQ